MQWVAKGLWKLREHRDGILATRIGAVGVLPIMWSQLPTAVFQDFYVDSNWDEDAAKLRCRAMPKWLGILLGGLATGSPHLKITDGDAPAETARKRTLPALMNNKRSSTSQKSDGLPLMPPALASSSDATAVFNDVKELSSAGSSTEAQWPGIETSTEGQLRVMDTATFATPAAMRDDTEEVPPPPEDDFEEHDGEEPVSAAGMLANAASENGQE